MFSPPPLKPGLAATRALVYDNIEEKPVRRQPWWALLLVPLVLVMITLSTRYLTHPAAFDLLIQDPSSISWKTVLDEGTDFRPHHRHSHSQLQDDHHQHDLGRRAEAWTNTGLVSTVTGGTNTASGILDTSAVATGATTTATATATSTIPVSAQSVPTVPTSPPVLPTPFPQPFSAGIPTDNMSTSCLNFFTNMTNSLAFRSCRPFSLLLQSSEGLIDAQTNLMSENVLIWGTCNVTPGKDQCISNMGWFASQLQSSCKQEVQSNVPIATDTLTALQAYGLMYDVACATNPATNAYCYVEAVQNSNPADMYLYQLPINIAFPNSATPTCSACSKDVLNTYLAAVQDPTQSGNLKALAATYNSGARAVDIQCGSTFVALNAAPPSVVASSVGLSVTLALVVMSLL
ncbi:hypothetical protein AX15_007062 [Amanita polypyramis BW_CC]|nr:hypothetical protein AX15_007062 [Amanita polypyramis BW_CC]